MSLRKFGLMIDENEVGHTITNGYILKALFPKLELRPSTVDPDWLEEPFSLPGGKELTAEEFVSSIRESEE